MFDPIAPVAVGALRALDDGDVERYERLFAPTVPLARRMFAAPTGHYKVGVVFIAYLNGHQGHFRMLGGMEARSIAHLAEVFRLASAAGARRSRACPPVPPGSGAGGGGSSVNEAAPSPSA